VFLPIELTRKAALTAINEEMHRTVAALTLNGLSARLALAAEVGEIGLLVTNGTALVKVETNTHPRLPHTPIGHPPWRYQLTQVQGSGGEE